jgi:hypothetical protein
MRSQLTSLKALIDAIVSLTSAQVDATTTLNPGDPATVTLTVEGSLLRFSFGIPKGSDGQTGQTGQTGDVGQTGAQGPPFAQAIVDAVNTLLPWESAWVTASFDGSNVHFSYGIPRGEIGAQGPPGEVTNAQLTAEIATTALNPTAIQPMSIPFSDPPTQAELLQVQDKYNELLTALKRP